MDFYLSRSEAETVRWSLAFAAECRRLAGRTGSLLAGLAPDAYQDATKEVERLERLFQHQLENDNGR